MLVMVRVPLGDAEAVREAPVEREYVGVPVPVLVVDMELVGVLDVAAVLVPVTVPVEVLEAATERLPGAEPVGVLLVEPDLVELMDSVVVLVEEGEGVGGRLAATDLDSVADLVEVLDSVAVAVGAAGASGP